MPCLMNLSTAEPQTPSLYIFIVSAHPQQVNNSVWMTAEFHRQVKKSRYSRVATPSLPSGSAGALSEIKVA